MMIGKIAADGARSVGAAEPKGGGQRERLLGKAALYRLIAQGFSYPEPEVVCSIRRSALDLGAAAARGELAPQLAPVARALGRAWRTAPVQDLATEYSRLFLGAGLVPLREGGYGSGLRFAGQPVDIADIGGFYLAFGFTTSDAAPNPPDHIGTEMEFVSLLHLKNAHALARRKVRDARIAELALGRFLEDHTGRWVPSLEAALREADASAPYALLGELMKKAVACECARLGVKPQIAGCGAASDPIANDTLICPLAVAEPIREVERGHP
jgi:TorA maturation chaperone TorD